MLTKLNLAIFLSVLFCLVTSRILFIQVVAIHDLPSFLFFFFFQLTFFSLLALQEQPNLRTRLDDAFLLRFLRARKFDYDRALQLLLNYHAGRKAWPEVFQDLKPSTVKHVLDLGFLTVLPRPDPNGRYILCLRPGWCRLHRHAILDLSDALFCQTHTLKYYSEWVILTIYQGKAFAHDARLLTSVLQENGNQMITHLLTMLERFIWLWRSWFSRRKRRWTALLF